MQEAAIELRDIRKNFGRHSALSDISFSVPQGEIFALLGPNGAGKTTLLNIICTLMPPDGGSALIGGADVVRAPLQARQQLGVVFQHSSLDGRLSVEENLRFHAGLFGVPRHEREIRISALLAEMGLEDRRKALVMTLSMGLRRRLEIARALLHQARILILDEPTVGLDTASRAGVWRYIDSLRRTRGLTVVVSTHYIDEVEQADRVCIIDAGRVIALDTPEALKARHGAAMLRVVAQNPQTQARILARYGDIALLDKGEIRLPLLDADFQRRFLAEFGSDLSAMSLERETLEGIFLSLTGRPFDPAKALDQAGKAAP